MKSLPRSPTLPRLPGDPHDIPLSAPLRTWLLRLASFVRDVVRSIESHLRDVTQEVNQLSEVGVALEAATTVAISSRIHHITGDAVIDTITPPESFVGWTVLVVEGAWQLGSAGNIAAPKVPITGEALWLLWDPSTETWYPAG